MKYKFNIFTGTFDLVNDATSGIQGPLVSTDNAITRWNGTSGNIVQDSAAVVQDGGGVQAQAFIFKKNIEDLVVIPPNHSMIATDLVIDGGEIAIGEDAELVII